MFGLAPFVCLHVGSIAFILDQMKRRAVSYFLSHKHAIHSVSFIFRIRPRHVNLNDNDDTVPLGNGAHAFMIPA